MSATPPSFQKFYTIATKATERALSLDESGNRKEAARNYIKAVTLIKRTLNMKLTVNSGSSSRDMIWLRRKLEGYLEMIEGRLGTFREELRRRNEGYYGYGYGAKGGYGGNYGKGDGYYSGGGGRNVSVAKKKDGWANSMERRIEMEILDSNPGVSWDDVSGLDSVKGALKEMVVLPTKRPDLYQGIRTPSRGLLLYGPPGSGKTLVAKAVATESQATFFSISASSLASKYHGESEQLMKALFSVAKQRQPSFIFIDEIDSILGKRGGDEHEASRRLKTEFLCMFDGATTQSDEKIFIMGATNRPQDLDEAVRRRLVKRFYVPLPDVEGRMDMMKKLRDKPGVRWNVSDDELREIAKELKWFSGSDLAAVCREAALMPLRDLGHHVHEVASTSVRPVEKADLMRAKSMIRPSVSKEELIGLEGWTREFGTRMPASNAVPVRSSSLPPTMKRKEDGAKPNTQGANSSGKRHRRSNSNSTDYRNMLAAPPGYSSHGYNTRSRVANGALHRRNTTYGSHTAPRPPRPPQSALRRQSSFSVQDIKQRVEMGNLYNSSQQPRRFF